LEQPGPKGSGCKEEEEAAVPLEEEEARDEAETVIPLWGFGFKK
jgi:hypothetical protein